MLKAGVTGAIGSGKSSVCNIFECFGLPVFNADAEGRRLLDEDENVKQQVAALLGASVIKNNKPDRPMIAGIVFNDEQKLSGLNAIIHPLVRKAFEQWIVACDCKIAIEEAAILFESGAYQNMDVIIVVTAPEKLRIERVMKRDKVTEERVRSRMRHQWGEEEKMEKADFIIKNDGVNMLIPQVLNIYQQIALKQPVKKT